MLQKEYAYFIGISSKNANTDMRQEYIKDLEKQFKESDAQKDGTIDRKEFEKLIHGYFELKGIKSTKENYDAYF